MGIDWKTVELVFNGMGISVDLQFCPWKRCLSMVRTGYADAILDVSKTPDREERMLFPEEPISTAPTVLFKRRGWKIPDTRFEDLSGLKAGTILGYHYCEELAKGPLRTEEGQSLANNFRKLLRGRIDVVFDNILVGSFTAHEMGIADQIDIVPGAFFCEGEANYLAFSRHSEYAALAGRFSQALRHFKKTEPYRLLLTKYGLKRGSSATE